MRKIRQTARQAAQYLRYLKQRLLRQTCTWCNGRGSYTDHLGGPAYQCRCWRGTRLDRQYPQGWYWYPGDVCEHGVYTGGCGPDYMCGACEQADQAGPSPTWRDRRRWVAAARKRKRATRRQASIARLATKYGTTTGLRHRWLAHQLSVALGIRIQPMPEAAARQRTDLIQ